MLIQKLHAFLNAPKTTLDATQNILCDLISTLLRLFLDVGDDSSDSLDDGNDQRAVCGGAGVIPERSISTIRKKWIE